MTAGKNYDVIIIGSGSIGAPAALNLSQMGARVLVVDRLASSGQGSNKAAIGGVRATHSDPAKIHLGLRSLEIFKSWKERYGDDIEWSSGGYCFLAYGEKVQKTLQELLITQKKYGLKIEWYDSDEILRRIPHINPVDLCGGTISLEDGHCSNLRANHAFYMHARKSGADFRFKEEVNAILRVNDRVSGVSTDKGKYNAPVVINAAGPWAAQIGALVGLEHPVMPDSHEAGITEPVQHFLDPLIVDIRPAPGSANIYFYQQETGQLNLCLTPEPQIWGYDCNETSEFLPLISKRVLQVMPAMANIRMRRTWRGLYPMTPDGFPIIGWSQEVEGYLMAIGMCGQGFMLGPAVGELLARMVTQEALSPDDEAILTQLSASRAFVGKEALK